MIKSFNVPGISFTDGKLSSEFCDLLFLNNLKTSQRWLDIIHIKLDMQMARDLFENIIRLEDVELNYVLKYSLWFTASILYCRCFNYGNGRKTQLDVSHIGKIDENLKIYHSEIKTLRDKYIAHADKNDFEKFAAFGILDFDHSIVLGISNYFDRVIVPSPQMVQNYIALSDALLVIINLEENLVLTQLQTEIETTSINDKDIIRSNQIVTSESKAQLYYEAGKIECIANNNLEAGLLLMSKAIDECPNLWEFYFFRAQVYDKMGDPVLAKQDYDRSQSLKELLSVE